MLEIVHNDAPWAAGFHPKQFSLYHACYGNVKPNLIANNTLKYVKIDAGLRADQRTAWNRPISWPLWLMAGLLAAGAAPAVSVYRRRESGKRPSLKPA